MPSSELLIASFCMNWCNAITFCRSARSREEWESAALHNANTRCNGLMPLYGHKVPETNFSACLARSVLFQFLIHAQGGLILFSTHSKTNGLDFNHLPWKNGNRRAINGIFHSKILHVYIHCMFSSFDSCYLKMISPHVPMNIIIRFNLQYRRQFYLADRKKMNKPRSSNF